VEVRALHVEAAANQEALVRAGALGLCRHLQDAKVSQGQYSKGQHCRFSPHCRIGQPNMALYRALKGSLLGPI
jgi:hypothetical protein